MRTRSKWIIVGSSLLVVGAAVGAVLFFARPFESRQSVTDFESCVAANNVVMEIYPRVCRDAVSGKLYTEVVDAVPMEPMDTTFSSPKEVEIVLNDWDPDARYTSPLTLTGTVPGNWSFEGSFPVILTDWDGRIIGQSTATLTEDWMTENDVPFTVTLEFDTPTLYKTGTLILKRDNPSGLPQNDDTIEIAIQYE